jgi:flagellar basal body-associated protein FliL
MAEEELIIDDEEDEAGEVSDAGGRRIGKTLAKILTYTLFAIVGIGLMVIVSVLVVNMKSKGAKQVVDTRSYDPSFRPRTAPLMTRKLKAFRVNLDATDESNSQVFVQCSISLAYDGTKTTLTNELVSRDDQIRSRINSIISSKRYDEINTSFKRENYLVKEILNEVNSLLMNGRVREVYITQFTIAKPT